MNPTHIVVHHSAIAHDGRPQLGRIDSSHKARGFNRSSLGYYVGYHTIIEQDGTKVRTRKYNEMGAHCRAQGRNYDAIGVCLAGNFSVHLPTEAQKKSLAEEVEAIQTAFPSQIETIKSHGQWGPTECWGKLLPKDPMEIIVDLVEQPSPWALDAIEKAKSVGILDWNNPKEEVGNMTMAWIFRKAGITSSIFDGKNYVPIENGHGYLTKEQVAVALDRMGAFDL